MNIVDAYILMGFVMGLLCASAPLDPDETEGA